MKRNIIADGHNIKFRHYYCNDDCARPRKRILISSECTGTVLWNERRMVGVLVNDMHFPPCITALKQRMPDFQYSIPGDRIAFIPSTARKKLV